MSTGPSTPAVVQKTEAKAEAGIRTFCRQWGESALPPTFLASMILAQSVRPTRWLNLIFPPILLSSTYFNVLDMKADSAGITGSWSAIYFLLARRQKKQWARTITRLGSRNFIHAGTQATCIMNMLACGYVYVSKKGFRFASSDLPR